MNNETRETIKGCIAIGVIAVLYGVMLAYFMV